MKSIKKYRSTVAHIQRPILIKVYPFILSLYPVLNLLASNLQEIDARDSFRAIIAIPVVTGLLYFLLTKLAHDLDKGGILTALFLVFFFSYGHLYSLMKDVALGPILIGRHRYLLPMLVIILLAFSAFIIKRKRITFTSLKSITLVSTFLVLIPILSILYQWVSFQSSWNSELETYLLDAQKRVSEEDLRLPDIYYIILDGYTRSDYLETILGFDNADFTNHLQKLGFYIAEESNTNFNWTALSLGSSLNMDYVQSLGLVLVYGNYPTVFIEPIRHSRVRSFLEGVGYSTIAFRTNYLPTEIIDADRYYTFEPDELEQLKTRFSFNSFETLLIRSSAGLVLWDLAGPEVLNWVGLRTQYPRLVLRETILYQLDQLEQTPLIPGPNFVFVHIVAPHSPYLFGPNGEYVNADGSFSLTETNTLIEGKKDELYTNQARYINTRIIKAVEGIIRDSVTPPIILIQGDHGPCINVMDCSEGDGLRLKFAILNAFLLPENCRDKLYPNITPINSFRIVFNCVFEVDMPLLEDRSYYTDHPRFSAYDFVEVTDEID